MRKILLFLGVILTSVLLIACGKTEKFNVTFDMDGGTPQVQAQEVEKGGFVTKPADPTKDGYTFEHWIDKANNDVWDFEEFDIFEDTVLKAVWKKELSVLDEVADSLVILFGDPNNVITGFDLPTNLANDVKAAWKSDNTDVISISAPDANGFVKLTVVRDEEVDVTVKLTATLTLDEETLDWSINLKVPVSEAFAVVTDKFSVAVTKENAGKTVKVENVALYYPQGGNGYYLSTADGEIAFVHGQTGMPEAGKLYNITAVVDNYYNSLQIKDVNFVEVEGTPDHVVEYELKTIEDIVALPKPSAQHVYGHDTFKFKDVKVIIDGEGNYNTFLVHKDFDIEKDTRDENNSVMIYYTSQINEIRALEGITINEIDLVLEGYRTDKHVWYFSYLKPMDDVQMNLTDVEKLAIVKKTIAITQDFPKAGTLELPTTGDYDAVIEWDFTDADGANNDLINLETGAVSVNPAARVKVSLTATITVGEETEDVVYEISIGEYPLKTIKDALELANKDVIKVQGVVTDKFANNTYGFEFGGYSIALYYFEALEIGKLYTIIGEKDTYNGLHQLKNIEIEDEKGGVIPEPFAIDDILGDNVELAKHIAGRVSIEQAEVTVVGALDGNFREITLKKNDVKIKIRFDKRVFGGDDSTVLAGLKVGDKVNYVGNLGWFNGPQLGFGPNTHVGEGWPVVELNYPVVVDFGAEAVTGYGAGVITVTNNDGSQLTIKKDRAQTNTSTFDPHIDKGAMLVMAPVNTAQLAFAEFDMGHLVGLNEIQFSFAAWSPTAFTKASALEDSVVALEVYDSVEDKWVRLKDSKDRLNVIEDLTDLAYVTVTYEVEGPGLFRLVYNAPNAASGNTTQALTFDNFIFTDGTEAGDPEDPELPDGTFFDIDFSTLAVETSYVTSATEFEVEGIVLERLNANISETDDFNKGVVLGIRTKNNWGSPYLQTKTKIAAVKFEFEAMFWKTDGQFNLNYADHIYLQTSTDGTTWTNIKDVKNDMNTESGEATTLTVEDLDGTPVYIRLFVESAGEQTGTYQLRIIVKTFKIWTEIED